ncbi:putative 1-acyl-sn-glycerol-3-phosphate acyltransferase [Candida viswanathii]|uniref:1-acyl-sn-glycerol-3-phosphate acyltransferase n=1 Tax=Candida viswanathii TaxID=5486 RepID=A0A367XVS1_9ASCO|nr:putative 1-acyl-sn-glycerol-3-phosphate acyltransferase [Candida viswanathii]
MAVPQTTFLGKVKFYLKTVLFSTLLAGCAIYGVFASIILRLIGKGEYAQYTVARACYYSCRLLMGLKINIKNGHYLRDLPAIVVSNHQSALDIFVLGQIFQPGYTVTSKKSLKYVPFLGWFMALSGTFFLDRSKSAAARKVLNSALIQLKDNGRALFIFPEGTRSGFEELDMLQFKKGAFHLAREAGIPIIPVVVSNTSPIFNSKRKIFNTGEINIEVLPPVPTADIETNEEITNLCNGIRDDMIKTLKKVGFSKTPISEHGENPFASKAGEAADEETITETTPLNGSKN